MDSDEALFQRLVAGDMSAFDRLYDRFERPLFGFIRVQLGDGGASEAEDVLHEAFMAVLRERHKVDHLRSFRAWLFEVARHLCLNRVRSRKRAERASAMVADSSVAATPRGAAEELERHEQTTLLERAVGRLPEALAEVYRLRATGMSYEEVAEILGIPVGTVKSRMHEMVKRLRQEVPQ
jgi:RNA polymerase sigma-70 factor (ECF subfamily)